MSPRLAVGSHRAAASLTDIVAAWRALLEAMSSLKPRMCEQRQETALVQRLPPDGGRQTARNVSQDGALSQCCRPSRSRMPLERGLGMLVAFVTGGRCRIDNGERVRQKSRVAGLKSRNAL